MSLELTVEVTGGHSAAPHRNAMGIWLAINGVKEHQMPARIEVPRQMFEYVGPKCPSEETRYGNLWLFRTLVERKLLRRPANRA